MLSALDDLHDDDQHDGGITRLVSSSSCFSCSYHPQKLLCRVVAAQQKVARHANVWSVGITSRVEGSIFAFVIVGEIEDYGNPAGSFVVARANADLGSYHGELPGIWPCIIDRTYCLTLVSRRNRVGTDNGV